MSIIEEAVQKLMREADILGELRRIGALSPEDHKAMLKASLDDLFPPKTPDRRSEPQP